MAGAAENWDGGTGPAKIQRPRRPAGQPPLGHPVISACRKRRRSGAPSGPRAPDERQPAYMAEIVVFGVVAADVILRVQHIPAPGD